MNPRWLYQQVHGRKAPRSPRRARSGRGPARDWRYRAWIRTQECACCGTIRGIEAAHTGSDGGTRQKASDDSCIPLCGDCHQFAPHSHHRDRAECERRVFARLGMTIRELVAAQNAAWFRARSEAA